MRRPFIWVLALILLAGLVAVYATFNPATHFFPRCPILSLTGYKCTGCGSQRAVYQLLHLHFRESLQANPLLLPFLPYLVFGFVLEYTALRTQWPIIRKTLYGKNASLVIFTIFVAFTILRNIYGF